MILFVLLFVPTVVSAADSIGKVVSLSGDVLARNGDTQPTVLRVMKPGSELYAGDVLNTNSKGSVKLLMTDKTVLDLGASTLFKVDEYELKNVADRKVALTMDYGKIRASVNAPVETGGHFKFKTKAAVMGVRGTEFIVSSGLADPPPPPPGGGPGGGPRANPKAEVAETKITVVSGKVDVTDTKQPDKAPIPVTQGKQLTTTVQLVNGQNVDRGPASLPGAGGGSGSGPGDAPKVVELSASEMKATVQAVKVEDTTFKTAVIIQNSNSDQGGGGGGSGAQSQTGQSSQGGTNKPEPPRLSGVSGGGVAGSSTIASIAGTLSSPNQGVQGVNQNSIGSVGTVSVPGVQTNTNNSGSTTSTTIPQPPPLPPITSVPAGTPITIKVVFN